MTTSRSKSAPRRARRRGATDAAGGSPAACPNFQTARVAPRAASPPAAIGTTSSRSIGIGRRADRSDPMSAQPPRAARTLPSGSMARYCSRTMKWAIGRRPCCRRSRRWRPRSHPPRQGRPPRPCRPGRRVRTARRAQTSPILTCLTRRSRTASATRSSASVRALRCRTGSTFRTRVSRWCTRFTGTLPRSLGRTHEV